MSDPEIRELLLAAVPRLPEPEDRLGQVRARVRRTRRRNGALAAAAVVAVAAVSLAVPQAVGGDDRAGDPTYRGTVMVVESPEADVWADLPSPPTGPRLCLDAPRDSMLVPGRQWWPMCLGSAPEVVGWDWAVVPSESAGDTRWGTYELSGTWDGARFTLTDPPVPFDPDAVATEDPRHGIPCPEPAGGWRPLDPTKIDERAIDRAINRARDNSPAFAGAWVHNPHFTGLQLEDLTEEEAMAYSDPAQIVLTMRFADDLSYWEQWVREVWGGALCIAPAERTWAELVEIMDTIHDEFPHVGMVSWGLDSGLNAVTPDVLIATPELQQEFDDHYGPGAIVLEGRLTRD